MERLRSARLGRRKQRRAAEGSLIRSGYAVPRYSSEQQFLAWPACLASKRVFKVIVNRLLDSLYLGVPGLESKVCVRRPLFPRLSMTKTAISCWMISAPASDGP